MSSLDLDNISKTWIMNEWKYYEITKQKLKDSKTEG